MDSSKRTINSKEEMQDISDANGQPLGLVGNLVLLEELPVDRRDQEKSRVTVTDGTVASKGPVSSKMTDPANTAAIVKTAEGRHPSLDMSESNNSLIGMTELPGAVASPVDSTRARSSLQVSGTNQNTGMTPTAPHQFPGQDDVQQDQHHLIGAVAVRGAGEEQDISLGTNIPDLEQQAVVHDNAGLVEAESVDEQEEPKAIAVPAIDSTNTRQSITQKDYFEHAEESGDDLDVDLARFLLETRQKAFDWIVNHDPMQLEYDSPNLIQRFLLVLFYYQTTRHKPWKVCNPGATNRRSSTTNFCYQIHPVTGDITLDIWDDQWLSDSHECQWAGVICENAQSEEKAVTDLRLGRNHLNGPLPWEITRLSLLRILRIDNNMLTGTLPPRLFSKKAGSGLETLVLSSNQFSGTIPAEWVADLLEGSGKLTLLALNRNTLTGMIPSELGLISLKTISLKDNSLTGSLPEEIFNQASVTSLRLGRNDLTGTLPSEVGLLTNLRVLDLNHTQISGSLPSEIGLANQLNEIILSNTNMQGTIPEELFTGLNLGYLYLDGCSFTGTISPSLGLLTNLKELHISNNHFHGTFPNEVEALPLLTELGVNGNDLTGTVPVSFCQNQYAGKEAYKLVADCLPNTETGIPAIQCPSGCCTSCCDDTGVCLAN
ncbi:receptor-like protein kinase precursor [Seminavis robusta]|uniref:Receptor-like protein kinase n=1 Tax=Seminavis robusta TaxID=568900 RepID=A0A9N8GZQ1_9STRA|nr:receptor-like protein kinase precursor [Seminavis robusta]|eukprot:Sro7_g005830.1 receptor-like protein kinase precursor (659) ;mRNA; r:50974-53312